MNRYPYLVGDVASNKPDASTAYQLTGTAPAGLRTFAAALSAGDITDGANLLITAYKFDANGNPTGAREVCWCTFADASPDTLTRGTLVYSTTGSKIDWSGTGEDFAPRIEVIGTEASGVRISQSAALSSAASYDIALRANCNYEVHYWFDFSDDQITVECLVSLDGSSFDNSAGNYAWTSQSNQGNTNSGASNDSDTTMDWTPNPWLGNAAAGEDGTGTFRILNASDAAALTRISGDILTRSYLASALTQWNFGGERKTAQVDVALRVRPSAGTVSGRICVVEIPA